MIKTVEELALAYAGHPDERKLNRAVFKYTECGASFYVPEARDRVVVSGYVEGWDGECQPHELAFPFTIEAFEKALAECDDEADEVWTQTHGCGDCGDATDGYVEINPNCASCKGEGVIL